MIRQSPRTLVEKLDFVTSVGYPSGPEDRNHLGLTGRGPRLVVTDLGVLRPRDDCHELELTQVHPGVSADQVRDATGWELSVSAELSVTEPPSGEELRQLRRLMAA